MPEITFDFRGELLRLRFAGDLDDEAVLRCWKVVLKTFPEVRDSPTLCDLRGYEGSITWAAIVKIANLRGRRPTGPRNRTAMIADTALYQGLARAVNDYWSHQIGRRVAVFESEEAALDWLASAGSAVARPPIRVAGGH